MGRSYHSGEYAAPEDPKKRSPSYESRKKKGKLTAEEAVEHIRENPTNRMPTKGTEMMQGVKDFFSPPRPTTTHRVKRKKKRLD